MRRFFLVVMVLLMGNHAFTKGTGVVSGRIFDNIEKVPLPFATVSVMTDQVLVTGTVADDQGRFTIDGVDEGKYNISISFIGYQTEEVPLVVGKLNSVFDLGRIYLNPLTENINEVTVIARKEILSSGLDKKSYDMNQNISQSGGSVLEAIRNLPGISVDPEGKVLLRGSDKVSVLIDGKRSSLTGFGNQKGLDNVPASNIERIEIINNPSAKYDSRGMAGIINIIYKKEKESGFNGEAGLTFGLGEMTSRKSNLPGIMDKYGFTPKYSPYLNLNYRTPKLNFFLQSDGIVRKKVNTNEFSSIEYADANPDIISQFLENRSQQEYNIKSGFDWFIDERNTLTLFALFQDEYHIDRGHVPYDYLSNGVRKRFWTWAEDENTRFFNYAANYRHNFAQPGHELETSFLYTKGGENELFPFTDSSAVRQSVDESHLLVDEIVSQFKMDYVKPLKKGRIELGSELQLRDIPISYKIKPGVNSVLDPDLGDWSKYQEDVISFYANLVRESEKFDVEGGLRIEETQIKYDIDPNNIYYTRDDSYDEFSLFPNIRLTYKLNEKNKFSAFFNRRVDRPGEFELRPFPKYDDPEILKTGNPYLRPQFTTTYELAYKRSWGSGSYYMSGFYKSISDIFSRIYTMDERTSETVINTIPHNLGEGENLGLEFSIDQKINRIWNLNGSFLWYENKINSFEGTSIYPYPQSFSFVESINNTWNAKLNNSFKLPGNAEIQATAIYYAPDIIPQGKVDERFTFDIGAKKVSKSGKLEYQLSANDIFNTFGIRKTIEGDGFRLVSRNYYETQVVTMGLKYKF